MRSSLCINITNGRLTENMPCIYKTASSGFPSVSAVGKYFKLKFLLSTHPNSFFMSVVAFHSCAVTLFLAPYAPALDLTEASERFAVCAVPCKLIVLLSASHADSKDNFFFSLDFGNCKQFDS